jgi:AcrR family transcriptional regulator
MATRSETHERIVLKAAELVRRFGPRKTAVADIAHELGMSPANIYKFFPSKRAIIEAVGERHSLELRRHLLGLIRSRRNAIERTEDLVRAIAEFIYSMQEESNLLEVELRRDFLQVEVMSREERWQFVSEFHDFLRAEMTKLICAGVEAGEMHVSDPAETAAALFDCLIWVIDPLVLLRDPKPVAERRLERQFRLLARALA